MTIYTKENLVAMKKAEVIEVAKKVGAKRYEGKKLRLKEDIIDDILLIFAGTVNNDIQKSIDEAGDPTVCEKEDNKYASRINVGSIIAFRERSGKLNTAKVVMICSDGTYKLKTKYGKRFTIKASDVEWVTTEYNKRWPKHIYRELKGIVSNG